MPRPFRLALALAAVALGPACGTFDNEAQRTFENTALLLQPEGFTETADDGTVVSRDADDWRVGPAFVGRVQVVTPPVPNPADRSDRVAIQLYTQGVPGGLALYTINARGDLLLIDERPDATAEGFYELSFFGSEATGGGGNGLYRLVVLDGSQRVLTYGDVSIGG